MAGRERLPDQGPDRSGLGRRPGQQSLSQPQLLRVAHKSSRCAEDFKDESLEATRFRTCRKIIKMALEVGLRQGRIHSFLGEGAHRIRPVHGTGWGRGALTRRFWHVLELVCAVGEKQLRTWFRSSDCFRSGKNAIHLTQKQVPKLHSWKESRRLPVAGFPGMKKLHRIFPVELRCSAKSKSGSTNR